MVWYAGLLDKGLSFAGEFLAYLREGDARRHEVNITMAARSNEASAKLALAVDDVAKRLESAVKSIVGNIIEKLEHDELEMLTAQIRTVHLALQMDNAAMLGAAMPRIMELIAYAKNRITEGKREWVGPWLMAESIRIIALEHLATSDSGRAAVKNEASTFRLNILDFSGQALVKTGNVPWVKISEFVQGTNEDVVQLIAQSSELDAPAQRSRKAPTAVVVENAPKRTRAKKEKVETSQPAATIVKTGLNPASAWPFPTGSRS